MTTFFTRETMLDALTELADAQLAATFDAEV